MSPGWGHLITWMDPSVGHLNGILARVAGNLNNNFQKSQMPRGLPGGACWSFDLTAIHYLSADDRRWFHWVFRITFIWLLARQTVNVNQKEKDLNIFYFSLQLTCKSGSETYLKQTETEPSEGWNLRKSSVFDRIVPVPARLTCKIPYLSGERCGITYFELSMRKLDCAKTLFRKFYFDNLCQRSSNSVLPSSILQAVFNDWCWTWKSRNLRSAAYS